MTGDRIYIFCPDGILHILQIPPVDDRARGSDLIGEKEKAPVGAEFIQKAFFCMAAAAALYFVFEMTKRVCRIRVQNDLAASGECKGRGGMFVEHGDKGSE